MKIWGFSGSVTSNGRASCREARPLWCRSSLSRRRLTPPLTGDRLRWVWAGRPNHQQKGNGVSSACVVFDGFWLNSASPMFAYVQLTSININYVLVKMFYCNWIRGFSPIFGIPPAAQVSPLDNGQHCWGLRLLFVNAPGSVRFHMLLRFFYILVIL